jgi:CRP-like cAMP-binding protein
MRDLFVADTGLIQALEKRSQPVSCKDRQVLFKQGEAPRGLYIVRSGGASLVMKSGSGKVVLRLNAVAGSLLGLPAVIGNEPYTLTAIARPGSHVRFVPSNDFTDVIREEPSLNSKVLEILATEVHASRYAISRLFSKPGRRRARGPV